MSLPHCDLKMAIETISFPVHYDDYGQKIFDSKNNLVAYVRGWGRVQYMSDSEKRQDNIGLFIAESMNSKWKHWRGVDIAKRRNYEPNQQSDGE